MVTFGEFVQHVLVSGIAMAVSLLVLVALATRYDDGHEFLRKALLALPAVLVVIAVFSLTATITETRCTDDPREFCRYNDNIPFMAMAVFIYVGVVLVRALLVFLYRPLTSGMWDDPPGHTGGR
ncbi:MAG: hypothetical protein AAGC53_23490 [Actinomycetota bacterium]